MSLIQGDQLVMITAWAVCQLRPDDAFNVFGPAQHGKGNQSSNISFNRDFPWIWYEWLPCTTILMH